MNTVSDLQRVRTPALRYPPDEERLQQPKLFHCITIFLQNIVISSQITVENLSRIPYVSGGVDLKTPFFLAID
jgi:hypothetical protein